MRDHRLPPTATTRRMGLLFLLVLAVAGTSGGVGVRALAIRTLQAQQAQGPPPNQSEYSVGLMLGRMYGDERKEGVGRWMGSEMWSSTAYDLIPDHDINNDDRLQGQRDGGRVRLRGGRAACARECQRQRDASMCV